MTAGSRITDPDFIWDTLRELLASGEEFPIRVEGAKTLPYAAVLKRVDAEARQIAVKLVRPLPPALAEGAPFGMVFAARGKRYEAQITYQGREGYLLYQFLGPAHLVASDRRIWKRYPIRPREDFHVTAQDSEFPGHGFTGPLLDLSMGGLAFRVDRMLRMDDGMPIRPGGHRFREGMVLPLLRVRGFPKGQVLDARGTVARVQEVNSELRLCVQFSALPETERLLLAGFLEARERQGGISVPGTGRVTVPAGLRPAGEEGGLEAPPGEAELPAGPGTAGLGALLRLDRRTARLLIVSPPGEDRERIGRRLEAEGYWRFDVASDLFEAHARWKEAASPARLLLVDLEPSLAEGLEAVGAVRHLEPLLRSFGEPPVAFLTRRPDPMLELLERPGFKALTLEAPEGSWGGLLDALALPG